MAALSSKVEKGEFIVLDELKLTQPKTKELVKILGNFKVKKPLLLIDENNGILKRAARNIKNLKVYSYSQINAYVLLNCDKIITTKDAIMKIQEKIK